MALACTSLICIYINELFCVHKGVKEENLDG